MSSTLPNTGRNLGRSSAKSAPDSATAATASQAALAPPAVAVSTERLLLTTSSPGDHPLVQRLLNLAGQTAAAAEFHLQLEEPGYLPSERIVIRLGTDLVGHVRLARREMQFDGLALPVAVVRDLAIVPEYRALGLGPALLKAAVEQATRSKVAAILWQSNAEELAASHGFVPLTSATNSSARPRDVLAALTASGHIQHDPHEVDVPLWPLAGGPQPLTLRWWRHYELPGLMRLYARQLDGACGAFARHDERWRWLISRHGYDRIYVAIDGPDSWELENTHPRLVGYAVLREARIVELVAAPERPDVAPQLLARACSDAVEQDCYRLHYSGPPNDPLHAIFSQATPSAPATGPMEAWQIKLLDLEHWLTRLAPEMLQRWRAAGLPRTGECGLAIDGHKWLLTIGPRGAKFTAGKLGRSYLSLDADTLARLLLGIVSPTQAFGSGALTSSTALAVGYADALFRSRQWWLPPWEDLPACS